MRRFSRRYVAPLAVLLGGVLSLSACSGGSGVPFSAAQQDTSRPNIVFVLTDDLSWNLVSHMPHVQALQKAGTTLSKYYVVDSLCCPSRSAIFTGQYPHDDGVFTNMGSDGGYNAYQSNQDAQKSFALSLQQRGYTTGFMGKYLNGYQPTDPKPPGWDEWDGAGNGYSEFNYTLNEDGKQVHYGDSASDYMVDVLSKKAGSFVDANAADHKPFMLEVATFAPHAPYAAAPRYAHAADGVPYPKTPAYNAVPSNAPSWLQGHAALTARSQQRITTDYDKRIDADLAVDDMIGHLEAELQAKGLAKNTYFVFSSDNGYHMGEYRLLPGKQTAFDTDINVPLVVSGPGVPAGHTSTQLTSSIDLAPTFESVTGAKVGSGVDGVSLAGIWHGQHPSGWQQAVLVEHHGPDTQRGDPDRQGRKRADPPSYEAVRTAGGLYVRYANGQQEFYDTTHDPYELHNLAGTGRTPAAAVPSALPGTLSALAGCHGATACQKAAGA